MTIPLIGCRRNFYAEAVLHQQQATSWRSLVVVADGLGRCSKPTTVNAQHSGSADAVHCSLRRLMMVDDGDHNQNSIQAMSRPSSADVRGFISYC